VADEGVVVLLGNEVAETDGDNVEAGHDEDPHDDNRLGAVPNRMNEHRGFSSQEGAQSSKGPERVFPFPHLPFVAGFNRIQSPRRNIYEVGHDRLRRGAEAPSEEDWRRK